MFGFGATNAADEARQRYIAQLQAATDAAVARETAYAAGQTAAAADAADRQARLAQGTATAADHLNEWLQRERGITARFGGGAHLTETGPEQGFWLLLERYDPAAWEGSGRSEAERVTIAGSTWVRLVPQHVAAATSRKRRTSFLFVAAVAAAGLVVFFIFRK